MRGGLGMLRNDRGRLGVEQGGDALQPVQPGGGGVVSPADHGVQFRIRKDRGHKGGAIRLGLTFG